MFEPGDSALVFTLPDQDDNPVHLDQFKGKWVVLYFYPKDNTPGCTAEACDFTDQLKAFEALDAKVLGVSPDSTQSHCKFITGRNLKITLLSDPESHVIEQYGAWQEKNRYGRKYWGVQRSTFLIDPEGRIAWIWPTVSVKGHVEEVRRKLLELKKG
jgi:thioredoxin-dependent peroxiredoxin